jgi:hypothetical protein
MSRSTRILIAAFVGSLSASVFGAYPVVTEHFDNNTDSYWDHLNNKPADGKSQDYGWSSSNNTGSAINPPGGTASAGGELGGLMTRIPEGVSNANYYAFNTGALNPQTDALHADGVYNLGALGGSTGFLLGFFKDATSFAQLDPAHHNDNPANFMGIYFLDGNKPQAEIWDASGFEDRSNQVGTTLANGDTVPFSMDWAPPPAGVNHEKGTLTINVNGSSTTIEFTDDFPLSLTHFGILGAGHSGGGMTGWLDDLSFSSLNPILVPEPASLSLLAIGGLSLARRRRA